LNGSPDGSRPTRRQISSSSALRAMAREKTLEMLWMDSGVCQSPTPYTVPSAVARAIPNRLGSTVASAGM
jgi:hypothetical protein